VIIFFHNESLRCGAVRGIVRGITVAAVVSAAAAAASSSAAASQQLPAACVPK